MNIKQALEYGAKSLDAVSIESKYIDSRLILSQLLQKSLEYIISHYDQEIDDHIFKQYKKLIKRRKNHEPVAYILGYKEFYGRNFTVNKHVLIPRPETEIIIDVVLSSIDEAAPQSLNILDLGTGSGIIAVTLAKEIPHAKIFAVDIDVKSLAIAKENASNLEVGDRIEFAQSNWYKKIPGDRYDFIISNPPYIDKVEQAVMALETKLYEPSLALYADNAGMVNYDIILRGAKSYLKCGGKIVLEIGYKQYNKIKDLCRLHGFHIARHYEDLSGHIRVLELRI